MRRSSPLRGPEPRLLSPEQRAAYTAQLRAGRGHAFATTAAGCTYRDAVYTRDRRPEFEIAWRRAEATARYIHHRS